MRNAYKVLIWKPEENRHLKRTKHKEMEITEMDFKELCCGVGCIGTGRCL